MTSHSPITHLSDEDAWSLLGSVDVGRLATAVADQPDIAPVNFVVDGRSLVFRSAEGAKLLALTINPAVALEVDSWEGDSGWSVVAKGTASQVTGTAEIEHAESLPLRPWVPTVKLHFVRIEVSEISGRQFRFGPEPDVSYT